MNQRWYTLLIFLAMGTTSVIAQPMRMDPAQRAKMLKDSLSLSDEQTKKVEQVYEDAQTDMMIAFETNQGDREAIRKAMMATTEKTDKKIESLLNDKQKKKFAEMKKRREAMRGDMQGRQRRN
jgi:hypothetical protein